MKSLGILTPTYNRGYILGQLYDSLKDQENHNLKLVWYIVDDGSNDDTEGLVMNWIKQNKIEIVYIKQENQGKMAALNNIMEYVHTDYCMEVDSDDYLTQDAIRTIASHLDEVIDPIKGLIVNRKYSDGKMIGFGPSSKTNSSMIEFYFNNLLAGDKNLVFKTEYRNKYHYKLSHNEKFSTEGRMFNQMAIDGCQLLYLPYELIVCEYQEDGYSVNIKNIYKKNPWTHYYYYLELLNFNPKISFKKKIHLIKHYILFGYLTSQSFSKLLKQLMPFQYKLMLIMLYIPGRIKSSKY